MNSFADYESMGRVDFNRAAPTVYESFSGTAVVEWQGNIERQLQNLLVDAEKSKNFAYADKVRKYLEIWRGNEITGSINREVLEVLKSATDILAVDNWNLANYFSNLRDRLRMLIASEEQLPRGIDMEQNNPMAGGAGGGGAPPLAPVFGAEKNPPGTPGEGEPGAPGAGAGPEGAGPEGAGPGGPGTEPGAEGAPGAPGGPGEEPLGGPGQPEPGAPEVEENPPFA